MTIEAVPAWKVRVPLFAFFAANLISFVGDRLTLLAIPWYVLQTTGSVTKTGITAFFTTLPNIVSAFLSGLLVDHLGYKRTSVIGDVASGVSMALIPLLAHTIGLAFWQLLVLAFLGGLLKAPGETARASLLPDLGRKARMPLERMNAIGDGMSRVSGLLGAPLAAVLIILIGASNLLWLDGVSFFISALLILSATFGGCAFLSTVLFSIFGHRLPRRMTFALCFIAIGMRFWALAFRLPLNLLFGVYALNGLFVGPINPIATTVEQEVIPVGMRARVLGTATAGYLAGIPLGGLVGGYLIAWIGLLPALFAMGACYVLATSSLLINPALKDMRRASVITS